MEKKTVQAVYENGVLRPLEPVPLDNRQEVTVTVSNEVDIPRNHQLVVSPDERADAAGDFISLDEVRSALATIRGSLSEAVIDERRDRYCPHYFLDTTALAKLCTAKNSEATAEGEPSLDVGFKCRAGKLNDNHP